MTGSDSSPRTAQPIKPGAKNLLSDVGGLRVGNAHNEDTRTGVTVILPDRAAVAACAIPGGGPGTRETDALQPANLVDRVDCWCWPVARFTGGCRFGVTAELGAQGRGFQTGAPIVSPIVPAAIYSIWPMAEISHGGRHRPMRSWAARLWPLAIRILRSASGAAYGAQAGQIKGGLGSASGQWPMAVRWRLWWRPIGRRGLRYSGALLGAALGVDAWGWVGIWLCRFGRTGG